MYACECANVKLCELGLATMAEAPPLGMYTAESPSRVFVRPVCGLSFASVRVDAEYRVDAEDETARSLPLEVGYS